MKFKLITLSLLLASAAMQSCSDDEPKGAPLQEGDEIEFGASLPDDVLSRTYYGPETTGTNPIWPIYWNYQGNKDQIYIYSPQALTGRNQAIYEVVNDVENLSKAADIQKVGNTGIQAGAYDGSYYFYAMYPASAVKTATGSSDATFTATLASTQTVSLTPTTTEDGVMKLAPDMNNCLMTGISGPKTLTKGEKVGIQFSPFVTALDITVSGPDPTTNPNQSVQITNIYIRSTENLAGDFTYTFPQNGTDATKSSLAITDNASTAITIPMQDDHGNAFELKSGEKLNLQAFILPNAKVEDLSIEIATAKGSKVQSLKMANTQVSASNVLKVTLHSLNPDQLEFNYKIWLSQLPEDTYISDISLPGAALAFNTKANGMNTNQVTQSTDLNGLFDAGIRAFQAHIILDGTVPSQIDGGSTFMIATADGKPTKLSLYQALQSLSAQMENGHDGEFCVLLLSDYGYGTKNASGEAATAADFYKRLEVITNEPSFKKYLATDIKASTTLAQVKGKIILKYQLNPDENVRFPATSLGTITSSVSTATMLNTVNEWPNINGTQALFNAFTPVVERQIAYSPLVYGNVGTTLTQNGNDFTPSTNTLMYYVMNNKRNTQSLLSYLGLGKPSSGLENGMWFIYSEQGNAGDNQSYVTANITSMKSAISDTYSTARNKFYMTYCGGQPNSASLQTMTDSFNRTWLNNIDDLKNCPYGWVMLNGVGVDNGDGTTTTFTTTQQVINQIINHNGNDGFNPGRPDPASIAPTGDTAGTKPGGSLFGN